MDKNVDGNLACALHKLNNLKKSNLQGRPRLSACKDFIKRFLRNKEPRNKDESLLRHGCLKKIAHCLMRLYCFTVH